MNWDAVGAVAELIGATGVIASLFYLGTQIRQNTRSVRSSSYHDVVTNLSGLSGAIGRDEATAHVLMRGANDLRSLSDIEQYQFSLTMVSLFRNYEDIFYQYRQEMIDESVWTGWSNSMTRLFWRPGTQVWWPSWRDDCHRDFCAFLEASTPPTTVHMADIISDSKKPFA